ncbi:acyl-CoA dehydrogenase family protein [Paraburkholderia unamae]|uniref:acyl-CoA dehydrogenase family protein n=1 Tax=Paraburkholderia unamae TaxID=219649 RepID=UPI00215E35BB|nr:acyl-CoA dehydrogenase family protein [Paraburkholderia unamae]
MLPRTFAQNATERARDLGPLIDALADEIERLQDFPNALLERIHATGIARILLPRSIGGEEATPWTYVEVIEELSRHDGAVGWNMYVANSHTLIVPYIPHEAAAEIFGDPRSIVASGPPHQFKALAVPGGYRINGGANFCSGSRQADWLAAHCQVVEPDGALRLNRFGRPTVRSLLFRKSHTEPVHNWHTLGMRGTASEGYRVDNLFIPEAFSGTFGEDPSLRQEPGPLYAFTTQGLHAVGVAAVALGLARGLLDAFADLATHKTPRGLKRLADDPVVQGEYARLEARLGAARTWLIDVLKTVWHRADEIRPIALDDRLSVRLAATHAIQTAVEVADAAYRGAGTTAIFVGSAFERRFRDIHTLSQQLQSRTAHFEAVGQAMLNGDPDELFL